MGIRLREVLMGQLDALRYEPTDKRIRGVAGDATAVDTTGAMLVWEPQRVVPQYAVPEEDVRGELVPAPADDADAAGDDEGAVPIDAGDGPRLVLDPRVPFSVHTAPGEPARLRVTDGRSIDAFRPADPALAGYVILDFAGFDAWYEEDERNVGHPRDPFHRIDILHSSRHVRIRHGGEVLADSSSPCLLFEPPLPVRYYLPPEDVRTNVLAPSPTQTFCAYKGRASYWSAPGERDIAWTYREPLREAAEIAGHVAFFDEFVDVEVDGRVRERPVSPWSKR